MSSATPIDTQMSPETQESTMPTLDRNKVDNKTVLVICLNSKLRNISIETLTCKINMVEVEITPDKWPWKTTLIMVIQ